MQTCWDCATSVWVNFARPANQANEDDNDQNDQTDQKKTDQSGPANPPRPQQLPRIQIMRPPMGGPRGVSKMVTETVFIDDNDSGNYSGM